jgi:hypothetical protein
MIECLPTIGCAARRLLFSTEILNTYLPHKSGQVDISGWFIEVFSL